MSPSYENVASELLRPESGPKSSKRPMTTEPAEGSHALSLLEEASTLLDEAEDLAASVQPVLAALSRHMHIECATLTVLNRRTSEILLHEAVGLTDEQRQRTRFRLGEGITGQVVETGAPVVVPSISTEPRFVIWARTSNFCPGTAAPIVGGGANAANGPVGSGRLAGSLKAQGAL